MTSQPMRVSTRSPDRTTRNMADRNRDTDATKTPKRSSSCRYQFEKSWTASPTMATATTTIALRSSTNRCSGICSWPSGSAPMVETSGVNGPWCTP